MGIRDWLSNSKGDPGKAAKATTPPMQKQQPKQTPVKQVRAVNPKRKR